MIKILGLVLAVWGGILASPFALAIEFETRSSVLEKKKVLVLFRMTAYLDGAPRDPLEGGWNFGAANLDVGGQIQAVPMDFPSGEARDKGWYCILLDPGDYYLGIMAPYGLRRNSFPTHYEYVPIENMWLTVPAEPGIIYAGTLRFDCLMEAGLLGMSYKHCTMTATALDESALAQEVIRQSAEGLPVPATQLMTPWAVPVPQVRTLTAPIAVSATVAGEIPSYKWIERSIEMNCGWGAKRDKKEMFSFDGLITFFSWLYSPIGASIGYFSGEGDRGKYDPCLQAMAGEMKRIDPAGMLQTRLSDALRSKGAVIRDLDPAADLSAQAVSRGAKTLLRCDLLRVRVRECDDRVTFCMETVVRVRVWNVAARQLVYESFFIYTNPGARPDAMGGEQPFKAAAMPAHPIYELPFAEASPCFKPDALCGDSGKKLIADTLSRTVELTTQAVLRDIAAVTINNRAMEEDMNVKPRARSRKPVPRGGTGTVK